MISTRFPSRLVRLAHFNWSKVFGLLILSNLSFQALAFAQSDQGANDFNAKARTMINAYFALDCQLGDNTLQSLDRPELTVAMGVLDLRLKCYADQSRTQGQVSAEKAEAIMQAFERAYPEAFETAAARYYLELLTGDKESQAEARKTLLGRHAVKEIADAGGDHLFLRERVRFDEFMIEVREDLSFLKNGLYGMRYQFKIIKGQVPTSLFILGSSRAAESEIKAALKDETDRRFFHLDYFGPDNNLGVASLFTTLPAYDTALKLVIERIKAGLDKQVLYKSHEEAALATPKEDLED